MLVVIICLSSIRRPALSILIPYVNWLKQTGKSMPYSICLLKVRFSILRSVVAPLLVRPKEYWSNFWGSLTDDGFYARSHDYVQIVKNERR